MSTPAAFSPAVVDLITTRDQMCCAWCGKPVHGQRGIDWSIHHRCPRSSGGTRRLWVGGAANGVVVHGHGSAGCHGEIESSRDEARARGFLVSAIGRLTAAEVEIVHAVLGTVWLEDDGTWYPARPGEGPTPESIDAVPSGCACCGRVEGHDWGCVELELGTPTDGWRKA